METQTEQVADNHHDDCDAWDLIEGPVSVKLEGGKEIAKASLYGRYTGDGSYEYSARVEEIEGVQLSKAHKRRLLRSLINSAAILAMEGSFLDEWMEQTWCWMDEQLFNQRNQMSEADFHREDEKKWEDDEDEEDW